MKPLLFIYVIEVFVWLCVACCPQMLTVKLDYCKMVQAETNMNCSDSSTDSSEGSPTGTVKGPKMASPNSEQERLLPSCVSQFSNNKSVV